MNTLSVKITDNLHYIGVNDRETHLFKNLTSTTASRTIRTSLRVRRQPCSTP